jgi:hypothetical protein
MHGPLREAQIGDEADLYVCGHRRTSGEFGMGNVARGRYQRMVTEVSWLAYRRARRSIIEGDH